MSYIKLSIMKNEWYFLINVLDFKETYIILRGKVYLILFVVKILTVALII